MNLCILIHAAHCQKSADCYGENKESYLIKTMLIDKIKTATRFRKCLNFPNKETCAFRLLKNEGDRLSVP